MTTLGIAEKLASGQRKIQPRRIGTLLGRIDSPDRGGELAAKSSRRAETWASLHPLAAQEDVTAKTRRSSRRPYEPSLIRSEAGVTCPYQLCHRAGAGSAKFVMPVRQPRSAAWSTILPVVVPILVVTAVMIMIIVIVVIAGNTLTQA